jgi:hypothetical protein
VLQLVGAGNDARWEVAREPLHRDVDAAPLREAAGSIAKAPAGVGPGTEFGARLAEAIDAWRAQEGAGPARKVRVGLVPTAVGATRIESWVPGGVLFENMAAQAAAARRLRSPVRPPRAGHALPHRPLMPWLLPAAAARARRDARGAAARARRSGACSTTRAKATHRTKRARAPSRRRRAPALAPLLPSRSSPPPSEPSSPRQRARGRAGRDARARGAARRAGGGARRAARPGRGGRAGAVRGHRWPSPPPLPQRGRPSPTGAPPPRRGGAPRRAGGCLCAGPAGGCLCARPGLSHSNGSSGRSGRRCSPQARCGIPSAGAGRRRRRRAAAGPARRRRARPRSQWSTRRGTNCRSGPAAGF